MAEKTKKIRLPVSIGIADPDKSKPELLDANGRLVQAAQTITKLVPAGTAVTLDADEADALLLRFGPYKETVIFTEGEVAVPAPAAAPVTNARRA